MSCWNKTDGVTLLHVWRGWEMKFGQIFPPIIFVCDCHPFCSLFCTNNTWTGLVAGCHWSKHTNGYGIDQDITATTAQKKKTIEWLGISSAMEFSQFLLNNIVTTEDSCLDTSLMVVGSALSNLVKATKICWQNGTLKTDGLCPPSHPIPVFWRQS